MGYCLQVLLGKGNQIKGVPLVCSWSGVVVNEGNSVVFGKWMEENTSQGNKPVVVKKRREGD